MMVRRGIAALFAIAVAFSMALVQPVSATVAGDWASFGLDNTNSRNQASSTITSANVASLTRIWSYRTGADVTSTPIVVDGQIYFADWDGNVYSVVAATGALTWQHNVGNAVSSTLLVADGRVYVGFGPNDGITKVQALDQSTGALVWHTVLHGTVNGIWASPTEMNGMLYIGIAAGNGESEFDPSKVGAVFALDASSGGVVWKTVTGGTAGGATVWSTVMTDSTLNAVYFGTGNSFALSGTVKDAYSIVSLDATTGAENWHYQVYDSLAHGGDLDFGSTPNLFTYVSGGVTYRAVGLGGKDGKYYIVNRVTGDLLQTYTIADPSSGLGIIGAGGFQVSGNFDPDPRIFVPGRTTAGGNVSAIEPETNSVLWQKTLLGDAVGSVALIPGAVLAPDTLGHVYALSTTDGSVIKRLNLPDGPHSPTAIYGGVSVAEGFVVVPAAFSDNSMTGIYVYALP